MPVDGVDVRRRAAGAARDDRERAARNPEDVRLLQGDGVVRSHRSHRAERRRVARRRLRRGARRSGSARRSRSSIRSGRSRSTPKKLGVDDARVDRADGGGGGRPRAQKGGRPMIRINLLAVERERGQEASGHVPDRPEAHASAAASSSSLAALVIGWRYWTLAQRVGAARRRDRRGAAGDRAAALDHRSRSSSSSSARRSCSSASR